MRNAPSKLLVAGLSALATLASLELAIRVSRGAVFELSSQIGPPLDRSATPIADYHPTLGWIPKPGVHEGSSGERWSVDDANLRSNGSVSTSRERPIVAVGDSFTFGVEVMDSETWPAQLEARLGTPVINGGVFAYGVDQAYLRARMLIDTYKPRAVLLAFISNDVNRTELSFYLGWKPYFEYADGELVQRNEPVPSGPVPLPRFASLRKALSYSVLCSALLRRAAPKWWANVSTLSVHRDGEDVSVELFDRLDAYARSRNASFAVVALGTNGRIGGNQRIPAVVEHARRRGIDVIDLVPETERLSPTSMREMFMQGGHYSPRMNGRVAERIMEGVKSWPDTAGGVSVGDAVSDAALYPPLEALRGGGAR